MRRYIKDSVFTLIGLSALAIGFNNCSGSGFSSGGSSDSSGTTSLGWTDTRSQTCSVPPVTITHTLPFTAQTTQKVFLDLNKYPLAVCNDGSPAMFAIRPGFGAAQSRWVIFLDGGASCWDQPSCTARASATPDLISSNTYNDPNDDFETNFGVLGPDPQKNPDLYDATVVRVHYCSSDGWTGNQVGDASQPGVIPASWNFQGHQIVQSVIHTLQAQYNFNQATELLFIGSSAGGVGVFNNMGWLSQNISPSVRFVISTDAGFINEVIGYDPNQPNGVSTASGTPYDAVNPLQQSLWNGTGDIFCEMTGVSAADHIRCAQGPVITAQNTGTLRVPIFLRQSLDDGVQLSQEGLDIQSSQPQQAERGYENFFGGQMTNSLNNGNNFVTKFAEAITTHGQMDGRNTDYYAKSYVFGTAPNQVTLSIQQALGIWYKNPCQLNSWIQPLPTSK